MHLKPHTHNREMCILPAVCQKTVQIERQPHLLSEEGELVVGGIATHHSLLNQVIDFCVNITNLSTKNKSFNHLLKNNIISKIYICLASFDSSEIVLYFMGTVEY